MHVFVRPIIRSQNPPYHGALLGMNFHVVPYCCKVLLTSVHWVKRRNVSAAATNVEPLSDNITFGMDFLLVNRRNAKRNAASDKSLTISKCTALVLAQVNRQMYTFMSKRSGDITCKAPV